MRKVKVDNPRYPHWIKIIRKMDGDWLDSETPTEDIVIYEGVGRSYTDTTTTGDAKVDTNKRKASIPVRFDEWGKSLLCGKAQSTAAESQQTEPIVPMSGDLLMVTKANITEEWEVKDFEPDNDRSIVYGELNRNLNM